MDAIDDCPDIYDWSYEREQEEKERKHIEWVGENISNSIRIRENRSKLAKILKDISDNDIIFMYETIKSELNSSDFKDIYAESGYPIKGDEKLIRIARNKPKKEYINRTFTYLDKYRESTILTNGFYDVYKQIKFIYAYSTDGTRNWDEPKASWIYVDGGSGHMMFKIPYLENIDELSADEIILLLKKRPEIKIINKDN